jgi:hypothetical protein
MPKAGMYGRQKFIQITQKENDNKIRQTCDERLSYFRSVIIHLVVLFIDQPAVIVDLSEMVCEMTI